MASRPAISLPSAVARAALPRATVGDELGEHLGDRGHQVVGQLGASATYTLAAPCAGERLLGGVEAGADEDRGGLTQARGRASAARR